MKVKSITLRYDIDIEWEGETRTFPFDVTLKASRVVLIGLCEPEFLKPDYYPFGFRREWSRGMPDLEKRILDHHHATQLREWAEFLEADK